MALDTFAGLKATIADYLNRDDLTSVIPSFITIAEAKFNRKLRVRQMVKRATATLDTAFFCFSIRLCTSQRISVKYKSNYLPRICY